MTFEVEHVDSGKRFTVVRPRGAGLVESLQADDEVQLAYGHDDVAPLGD